jgi:large subunit ribosomal protein L4
MAALSPDTYTKSGTKATTAAKLDKSVFSVMPENFELLKLAYIAYLANGRDNLAKTKTRGLVSGGGKKPHKQKGTGRARSGSTRNPIWRGGGIVFGPTGEENYTKKLPVESKKLAVRQALSMSASENRIKVIESLDTKDGKTKNVTTILNKLGAKGNILLVVDQKDDLKVRSTRNLPNVKLLHGNYLNVFDLMNADTVIFEKSAVELVHAWLGDKK